MTCSPFISVTVRAGAREKFNHKHAIISECKYLQDSSINDHKKKTTMHQDVIVKEKDKIRTLEIQWLVRHSYHFNGRKKLES